MNKSKMHTPDFTQENIAKLAALFPNCVTETRGEDGTVRRGIDFDQLRQELSDHVVEGPRERYHLDWPGKREALLAANAPIAKTLRPCREESVDFDTTKNLFIEGDNLDALKLLQETYLNKVKMIYIDPPYNTGNDFIYEDDFTQTVAEHFLRSGQEDESGNRLVSNPESNGRFHSDWMCMMYPRLRLARNLLRDDGVIFISIDDGEGPNLRKMCDEIFGERNFIASIAWQRKQSPQRDATSISTTHDLILVYAKYARTSSADNNGWVCGLFPKSDEQLARYTNPDNDPRGVWTSMDCTINKTAAERPNLYYPIRNPTTGEDVFPSKQRTWTFDKKSMEQLVKEKRIWWGQDGQNFPRIKSFLAENKAGVTPFTFWKREQFGDNQEATRELRDLFSDMTTVFDTPKPVRLIKQLIFLANCSDGDIILDFFTGSATTAHALMQINSEDAIKRHFILVQLPEAIEEGTDAHGAGLKTISDFGKERIRRAANRIRDNAGLLAEQLDLGFRVLKIDTSNMKDVYYQPVAVRQKELFQDIDNIKEDRTEEDLLFQVLLDWGVDLSVPITREQIGDQTVFFVDHNALAACFATGVTEDLVKLIAHRQPLRVVFRDAGFQSDAVKINVEQIFRLLSPGTEVRTL
jgi:adenine-specific DNA-methyltransferase